MALLYYDNEILCLFRVAAYLFSFFMIMKIPQIDSFLRQGKTSLLKRTKEGSEKDTSYRVEGAN